MDFGFGDTMPFASRLKKQGPRKPDPVARDLACSLEELYNGCTKALKVTRKASLLALAELLNGRVRAFKAALRAAVFRAKRGMGGNLQHLSTRKGFGAAERTCRRQFFLLFRSYFLKNPPPARVDRKGREQRVFKCR